jgi:hypothetical protein
MIAIELGVTRVHEALRVVRALGTHRYVGGRLHLVHALAIAALPDDAQGALAEAASWAAAVLADTAVDPASRDECLWRRSSEGEVVALLDGFWTPGDRSRTARDSLASLIAHHGLPLHDHPPFDESSEPRMHPLLVDAGWELLPLANLDGARHAGGIGAFGDALAFESARLEEEVTTQRITHLYELPAIGAVELLRGADDDGVLAEPLVVWAEGNEIYLDYVMRGVGRAARL